MSHNSCNIGYIYIYKCVVGNVDNICKIGKTTHFRDKHCRIVQSLRTPYFGFMPYMQFDGTPIVTGFKVRDVDVADAEVHKYFKKQQVSTLEIYVTDYIEGVKKLHDFLVRKKLLIEIMEDDVTDYSFLKLDNYTIDTTKSNFKNLLDSILLKYNNEIPSKLLPLFKGMDEFREHCKSHYNSGNYISIDNLVLDLHVCRPKRIKILSQISDLL